MRIKHKDNHDIHFEKVAGVVSQHDPAHPRIRHALLAITILIAALIAVWPAGSQGGITWAQVAERMESVTTVIAMTETVDAEARVMHRARIYFKDPGLSRTEVISIQEPETGAESIMIIRREMGRAEQLTLVPKLKQAHLVTHKFQGSTSERQPLINMVAESWRRISRITSAHIRTIGERRIEGVMAVGFESPAEEFFGSLQPGIDGGAIRIWVDRDEGVPLRVELRLQKTSGSLIQTTLSQIEWNVPMADELFETRAPDGWQVRQTRRQVKMYSENSLAGQITLRIGPNGGQPIVSEMDVVAVAELELIEEVDSQIPTTTRIALELSTQALERLQSFAAKSPQEPLFVNFNNETQAGLQLGAMTEGVLRFDVSHLGLSLTEFEDRYLKGDGIFAAGDDKEPLMKARECSSFVLNHHGSPVLGTNFDHGSVKEGLVFVNKRGLEKTGLHPSTIGEHMRWRSRYASITFNLVGYQFAWAGMNEKGLTLSTMSLAETEVSAPDERPPLDSGEWMQFILDTCATVDDLVASDARVRTFTVDHYLVADSLGNCAVVEFLDGEMVVHTGPEISVTVLTNSTYSQSALTWFLLRDSGNYSGLGTSLARFCFAADRVESFVPGNDAATIAYAFDTLEIIRGEDFDIYTSQWSIVFDTLNLRAYFRTHLAPEIRYLDLESFELGCGSPVQMLNLQAPLSGDVADAFFDFSYDINFEHTEQFMINWDIDISPQTLHRMLQHFENFPCVTGRPRKPAGRFH